MSGNVGEVPHIFLFSSVVKSELEIVVESELDTLGFDLVDLRRHGSRARPVVEVRIDRRDGERVTVDDCAKVSRAIERLVGEQTELQVSSPGTDRPLKTEKDWRRFVGRRAVVKSAALGGRKEVEIAEVNGTGDDVVVTLREPSDGAGSKAAKTGDRGMGSAATGSKAANAGDHGVGRAATGSEAANAGDRGVGSAPTGAPSREAAKAREYQVPLSAIDEARLTFHWDRGVTDGRFR
jgi:ribosome maturation factor RimP